MTSKGEIGFSPFFLFRTEKYIFKFDVGFNIPT